jgi:hypothetical protein
MFNVKIFMLINFHLKLVRPVMIKISCFLPILDFRVDWLLVSFLSWFSGEQSSKLKFDLLNVSPLLSDERPSSCGTSDEFLDQRMSCLVVGKSGNKSGKWKWAQNVEEMSFSSHDFFISKQKRRSEFFWPPVSLSIFLPLSLLHRHRWKQLMRLMKKITTAERSDNNSLPSP